MVKIHLLSLIELMKYLFLLFFSGLMGSTSAQLPVIKEKQPISSEASFPETWTGIYRGQLDDSRPGNGLPVNGSDIRAALDRLLAGDAQAELQKPSIGCNIKWRSGSQPNY